MKKPFYLLVVLKRMGKAVEPCPKAAMFELYDRGYKTLFKQVISCIISIRTVDETTFSVSEKLFSIAKTPKQLLTLFPKKLEKIFHGATFHGQKTYTVLGIARTAIRNYKGALPDDFDKLTQLKDVGPKCANLAVSVLFKSLLPNKRCCNFKTWCQNKNGLTAC